MRQASPRGFFAPLVQYTEVAGTRVPLIARSLLPPTIPQQINGVAARTINFPAEFNCYALDVVIDNRDAVNNLTFRLNGNSGATKTITASGAFQFSDQIITMLEILAGSTNWEVTFSMVPLGVQQGQGWTG